MINLISKEMFNTSMGTAFIIEDNALDVKIGDMIIINGNQYKAKKIIEHSKPTKNDAFAIIV